MRNTAKIKRYALSLLLLGSLLSATAQLKVKPLNLSLWEPVAFPKFDSAMVHYFSLGLLQSKTPYLSGLTLNTIAGRNTGDVKGVMLSGVININAGKMQGFQGASVWNATFGDVKGAQLSIFSNMAIRNLQGWQMSGMFNMVAGEVRGAQIGALTNLSGGDLHGFQVAPVLNITLGTANGFQGAIFNMASKLHGIQLGAINITGDAVSRKRGLQVGIINLSRDTSTVQLGLVNATRHTNVQMLLFGGTMYYGGAAIKFKNAKSYSILGFGLPYISEKGVYSGAALYRAGYYYPYKRFELSGDFGFAYISVNNTNPDKYYPSNLYSLQARVNLEYRLTPHIGIVATAGWARDSEWFLIDLYRSRGFLEFGVTLF